MPTTIPSVQLEAITRLELAAIALHSARRAVEHPDLYFAGGAIIAPSGLKHLSEIRTTLRTIEAAVRPSDRAAYEPTPTIPASKPPIDSLPLTDLGKRVLDHVTLGLATAVHAALARARQELDLLPELQSDSDLRNRVLNAAFREGSSLGRRIYELLDADGPTPGRASV